jgi:hypothetical protein
VLLVLLFSGCSQVAIKDASTAQVNHVILLWLKDPSNLHQKQQVIEATESLRDIPGVVDIRVGESIPSKRAVVDDSFTLGIRMLFSDEAAMERYVSHPEHVKTVTQSIMPFVDKIVIYDFRQ